MRCPQCGWPNVSSANNCSKCGCDLNVSDVYDNSSSQPHTSNVAATVNESVVFPENRARQEVLNGAVHKCPKCGYELRPGTNHCPQCNCLISGNESSTFNVEGNTQDMHRRPTQIDIHAEPSSQRRATVNPFLMQIENSPSCSLEPVTRANEKHTPSKKRYEGDEIVLTRSNTDAENPSITSKQQAILSYKEGQWYIEDKSEQHTTFVQVSGVSPLKEGDYVLLGNRLFIFHLD